MFSHVNHKNDFILHFLWIPNLNTCTGLEGINYQLLLVKSWLTVKVWRCEEVAYLRSIKIRYFFKVNDGIFAKIRNKKKEPIL